MLALKRKTVRLGLAVLFSLGAAAQEVPKADIFLGYSLLRTNSATVIPAFTSNGGLGTLGLNFNNHIGLEAEFGGYYNGNIHNYQLDTTSVSFLFGPRLSAGRSRRVDPYFHVLFGGMHASTSIATSSVLIPPPVAGTPVPPVPSGGRYAASQANFAMAAGGGLDIKLGKKVVLRPIQVDYVLTRFQSLGFAGIPSENRNQNNVRFAAGFMFNLGGERATPPPAPPAAPKMKPCPGGTSVPADQECPKKDISLKIQANPIAICPGAVAKVSPTAALPDGALVQWTVNGEPAGQPGPFEFASAGRNPGAYTIGLKVTAEGYNDASADTAVTVQSYVAPSGSLNVSPPEIWVGEKATLAANFTPGQCGGPMGPVVYSAEEGSASGTEYDSTGVRFDPANTAEQRKTITIMAKVSDERGSGQAQGTVVVKQRGAILAKRFPDIVFPKGSARVNNCGKRVLLEELKSSLDSEPNGNVVFVGHTSATEKAGADLDARRALNAAAVISAGTQVCLGFPAANIRITAAGTADNGVDFQPRFCESSTGEIVGNAVSQADDTAKDRRVEVWFVPPGGVQPASAAGSHDALGLNVKTLGCPK